MPKWNRRVGPAAGHTSHFPCRTGTSNRWPVSRRPTSSGAAFLTMAGSRTSTARTIRPVACWVKKRRYASTSGSSGTAVVLPKGSPTSAEGSKEEAVAEYIRVASLAEVPEGELRGFELAAGRIAVAHVENELFALGDECTHEGCLLSEGEVDESADTVVCACHGSAFDLRTGEPVEGPAKDPVPTFPVRLVEGWIELVPLVAGGDACAWGEAPDERRAATAGRRHLRGLRRSDEAQAPAGLLEPVRPGAAPQGLRHIGVRPHRDDRSGVSGAGPRIGQAVRPMDAGRRGMAGVRRAPLVPPGRVRERGRDDAAGETPRIGRRAVRDRGGAVLLRRHADHRLPRHRAPCGRGWSAAGRQGRLREAVRRRPGFGP